MEIQDFAREYESKSDDELTEEARSAFLTVLHARGIDNPEHIAAFRRQEESRKEEQAKDIGNLWVLHGYGIGRNRFGKAEYTFERESGLEQFVTTVFVVLFWIPLIPTGTYRVQRKRAFLSNEMTVLQRLPLDWEQVLKVWIIAMSILLVAVWAFKLLPRLLFR